MPSGTGVDLFQKEFPDRTFDVGIAEQHGVTFAAGLATEGFKPFATIYSTFLQRAYDQVVHDVAIQTLPVRFAMDRAGLVGADGPTHAGSFDIAYLGCLPGFVLMAAADEAELVHMVATAVAIDDRPSALRYPRGEGRGVPMPEEGKPLEIGKGAHRARRHQGGAASPTARGSANASRPRTNSPPTGSRPRSPTRASPSRSTSISLLRLAREHEVLLTVEEGSIGGFGSFVLQTLAEHGVLDRGLKVRLMVLPDIFIDQDLPNAMYAKAGLDAKGIVAKAFEALGQNLQRRRGQAAASVQYQHGPGFVAPRCERSEPRRATAAHPARAASRPRRDDDDPMTARQRADRLSGVARPVRKPRPGASCDRGRTRHRRRRSGAQGVGRRSRPTP